MDIATSIRAARISDHAQLQALFEELDRFHRDRAAWLLQKAKGNPARRLYETCEKWALERKASWVEVNVYEFNVEAYDFYASAGFETTMRRMRKPLAN